MDDILRSHSGSRSTTDLKTPNQRRGKSFSHTLYSRITSRRSQKTYPTLSQSRPSNKRVSTAKQRRHQQELIEVRVRSHHAFRQRAQRAILWLSLLTLVGVSGAGIYWAATRGVHSLFYDNPDYNITQLTVETDGVLSRNAILAVADIHEGTNIFHVNLDQIRTRLAALTEIQSIRLERQLPNKISIFVTERKPIAWVAPDSITSKRPEDVFHSSQAYLIDGEGMLLRPAKILASSYHLPIIRGVLLEHYTVGQKVETPEMQSTLELLKLHQESIIGTRFQISDIDLSRGYGLQITDAHSHLQVLFGLNDPQLQLQTLEKLLQAIEQTGRKPATISLMTLENRQRNIPVTFFPGGSSISTAVNNGNQTGNLMRANEDGGMQSPKTTTAIASHPITKAAPSLPQKRTIKKKTPSTSSRKSVHLQPFE